MIHNECCPNCSNLAYDCVEQIRKDMLWCHTCEDCIEDTTLWVKVGKRLPQGDERQMLIKRDNGRGGYWIDIAWWRPSANIFDDGLAVDFWCEIPE